MRRSSFAVIVPFAMLAVACGSSNSTSSQATPAASATPGKAGFALSTKTLPGVGAVLVNGQGRTLYTFAPDNARQVTCTGGCASIWRPLAAAAGQKPAVSGGVNASMVSSDANPAGGQVVTYGGWPLYLYTADPSAGTDHGQAINSSGGLWYVISASGKVVKAKASSGGSSSSSGGSAYGGY